MPKEAAEEMVKAPEEMKAEAQKSADEEAEDSEE